MIGVPFGGSGGGGGAAPSSSVARALRTTNQSIPNSTVTPISFDTQVFDTATLFDTGTPTSMSPGAAGHYLIGGEVYFAAASGVRQLIIQVNGTTVAGASAGSTGNEYVAVDTLVHLAAADVVTLCAYQNSGGAVNVVADGAAGPVLWMAKV